MKLIQRAVTLGAALMVATLSFPTSALGSSHDTTTTTIASSSTTTTTTSTTSTTSTTTTTTTPVTTTTTTTPVTTTTRTPDRADPFRAPVVANYLKTRDDLVTAALYDVRSGQTYVYNHGVRERTASMVKIDILAALLYESQEDQLPLTTKQQSLAAVMIEDSNNKAATKLWGDLGGRDAIDSFNDLIGFTQTIPSYTWGDLETTPLDQLQLLKAIVLPNKILSSASRDYEMSLMEGVISSERFGLGWGSPPKALVGLKDGYYQETTTGWQLNSSGFVKYQGRVYLATIMTARNPNETYGIENLTTIANLIWKYLKP